MMFPLLDLGDGLPAAKSTIELYESVDALGICNHLAITRGYLGDRRRLYDRDGNVFRIGSVTPDPQLSGIQRFMAHVCYNPRKTFHVELQPAGRADLDQMKNRIRELLENDPGDLLYQWTEHEEWKTGLNAAQSIPELFDFITKRALVDHYDEDDAEGK